MLLEDSFYCYLVEDVKVDYDVLVFDCFLYDGFVIRVCDLKMVFCDNVVMFEVIDYIGVGVVLEKEFGLYEVVCIMIGV